LSNYEAEKGYRANRKINGKNWKKEFEIEAIVLLRKVIKQEPNDLLGHMLLAISASMGGFDEEAQAAAKEVLRIDPQFSVKRLTAPFKDKIHLKNACDALNKADLSLECDALK